MPQSNFPNGPLYLISRRPDLDSKRIGAILVQPGLDKPASGKISVLLNGTQIQIDPVQLAATDGLLVSTPNRFMELPIVIDKCTVRKVASSIYPAIKQPQSLELFNPRKRSVSFNQSLPNRIFQLFTRLSIVSTAFETFNLIYWPKLLFPFLNKHKVIYLKPAGATGHGSFVLRMSLCKKIIKTESSDERLTNLPKSIPSDERLLGLVLREYINTLLSYKRTPFLIAEEGINSEKINGKNVDFRIVVQYDPLSRLYEPTATYAKIGVDDITANIGSNGHGACSKSTIYSIALSCFPNHNPSELESLCANLLQSMLYSSKLISSNLARLVNSNDLGSAAVFPPLVAVDFALVREGNTLIPWLVEVNEGPVQVTGLKSADPISYKKVLSLHEENLKASVERYKATFSLRKLP